VVPADDCRHDHDQAVVRDRKSEHLWHLSQRNHAAREVPRQNELILSLVVLKLSLTLAPSPRIEHKKGPAPQRQGCSCRASPCATYRLLWKGAGVTRSAQEWGPWRLEKVKTTRDDLVDAAKRVQADAFEIRHLTECRLAG
jgi:hypothetical protein